MIFLDNIKQLAQDKSIPANVRNSRNLSLFFLIILIIFCIIWEMYLSPIREGGSYLALKSIPLIFALKGIILYRLKTYRALSLFIWLYFLEGVVRATSDKYPSSLYALIEIILVIIVFAACVIHIKARLKNKKNDDG